MRRFASIALLVCSLQAILGCDTVGAALVDDTKAPDKELLLPCPLPPPCDPDIASTVEVPVRSLPPVDLEQCHGAVAQACVDPDAGVPQAPAADLSARLTCRASTPPYQEVVEPGVPCGPEPTVECDALTISVDAPAADEDAGVASGMSLPNAVWLGAEILIEAEQPLELTLEQPWLFDVSITLRGPITLRIVDSQLVRGLRVRTADSGAAGARLELEHVVARHVLLGEPAAPLASLGLTRTDLMDMQLTAEQMRFESVTLNAGLIDAGDLLGIDGDLSDLELAIDRMLLTSFSLRRSRLTRCQTLTMIGGQVFRSQFEPCQTEAARLYSTSLLGGTFDGAAESDRSHWSQVAIGSRGTAEVTAWGSSFGSVALCTGLSRLQVDALSSIKCSSCPDGVPDVPADAGLPTTNPCEKEVRDFTRPSPDQLCRMVSPADGPGNDAKGDNFCALPHPFPPCSKPYPERARPLPRVF